MVRARRMCCPTNMAPSVTAVLVMLINFSSGLPAAAPSSSSPSTLDLSSNFLPESFPSGDPSTYALPVYLAEPQDAYAAKGHPGVLTCKVAHANKAYFLCNEDEVRASTSERDLVDAKTDMKYKEITLSVRKSDVMDVLGNYSCACHAESSQGQVQSREAIVRIGYLRRDFETPPYSQQIELGRQAELRCYPPRGEPEAKVTHWTKDGVRIDSLNDPNFIQSHTGHLLILQARLEDTANYSCVASNSAVERKSPPATVTVYIPGQWGSWSDWSKCNSECGIGVRKRTRQCNSPAPVNDGPGCQGTSIQKKTCDQVCPSVDGQWSSWTSWSSCSPDCVQFRRRDCNNPAPQNRGRYCTGKDLASQNCTGGMCKPGLNSIVIYGTEPPPTLPSSSSAPTDLTLLVGLVVAFLVFIVVVLIIIRLLRKKSSPHSGYAPAGCDVMSGAHHRHHLPPPSNSSNGIAIGKTPRVNYNAGGGGNNYNDYSDKNSSSNGSNKGTMLHNLGGFGNQCPNGTLEWRPMSEHFYEQPMVVFPPTQSPADSLEKTPFIETTRNSNSNSNGSSGQPSPTPFQLLTPPEFCLPSDLEPHSYNWSCVTDQGTRISLPKSAVSLTVPQGACPSAPQNMFVALLQQNKYRPHLDNSQTVVTPVVQCGPVELSHSLQKPVVLSLPHDAGSGLKRMMVLYCADLDDAKWEVLTSDDYHMQVDSTMVHLVTENLGAYALVANLTDLNQIGGGGGNSIPRASVASSSGCSSLGSPIVAGGGSDAPTPTPKLSPSTKQALCRILDVPSCEGNGWQQLAKVMGAENYSSFFAKQVSPSEALLNLWEVHSREPEPLKNLALLLKQIRREDAIVILERDLRKNSV